ncbi:hypothetical protein V8E53_011596 [Lactarius tabidus]
MPQLQSLQLVTIVLSFLALSTTLMDNALNLDSNSQVRGVGVASTPFQYKLSRELQKRIHGAGADECSWPAYRHCILFSLCGTTFSNLKPEFAVTNLFLLWENFLVYFAISLACF